MVDKEIGALKIGDKIEIYKNILRRRNYIQAKY